MAYVSTLNRYPREHVHIPWGTAGSILLHLFMAGTILFLGWFFGVKSIEQLMKESGALAIPPPPQNQPVEVELQDELPPPPPVENPEFIRQIIQPKPVPPPPLVKKVPPPKPHPLVAHASHAVVSQLVVGSMQFPQPGYPYEAEVKHEQGTVIVSIQFDNTGRAGEVTVLSSSGHADLDESTEEFIRDHWKDPDFAGRTASAPIQYTF